MVDVFVNYRTLDSAYVAATCYELLSAEFGPERVFRDCVSIRPGDRYPDAIRQALEEARVLLVLIGPQWLAPDPSAQDGRRLIDDEQDWVRREIRRALARDIPVIPVLLDGARLPGEEQLPSDIRKLFWHQALTVGHRTLGDDVRRLARRIEELVPELGRSLPPSGIDADPRPQAGAIVDEAAHTLRTQVRDRIRAEIGRRELERPVPIPVRWSVTERPVRTRAAALDSSGLPHEGDLAHLAPLTQYFRGAGRRQLVVLGAPGSGKSVLVLLLTGALLDTWQPGDPVPVLLPLSTWRPAVDLPEWMAQRIVELSPQLRRRFGRSMAARLISERRVLAVLDGLDELPASLHARAVKAIEAAAAKDMPLVLTCRADEYETTGTRTGERLTKADVVELAPVEPDDALDYLTAASASGDDRWDEVFAVLRDDPRQVLAEVLSSPLMLHLARTAYQAQTSTPRRLLEFRTRAAVEAHLLERYLPTVYGEPSARRYGADRAARYLRLIARQMQRDGTFDFAWWQINSWVTGPLVGLAFGCVWGWFFHRLLGAPAGVLAGVVTGLVTFGAHANVRSELRQVYVAEDARYGPRATLPRYLVIGVLTSVVVACVTGSYTHLPPPTPRLALRGDRRSVGRLRHDAGVGVGVLPGVPYVVLAHPPASASADGVPRRRPPAWGAASDRGDPPVLSRPAPGTAQRCGPAVHTVGPRGVEGNRSTEVRPPPRDERQPDRSRRVWTRGDGRVLRASNDPGGALRARRGSARDPQPRAVLPEPRHAVRPPRRCRYLGVERPDRSDQARDSWPGGRRQRPRRPVGRRGRGQWLCPGRRRGDATDRERRDGDVHAARQGLLEGAAGRKGASDASDPAEAPDGLRFLAQTGRAAVRPRCRVVTARNGQGQLGARTQPARHPCALGRLMNAS
ncbi:TIR domain-containing protein [Streptomyces mexicanus]|uniref:TIR domain-containing protein n=1 Tax=Streptomyces mexicanus TaxID=178566 RepID=UPI001357EF8E|nr:TIR domain-containing protein [Streptomyces mexicanus]